MRSHHTPTATLAAIAFLAAGASFFTLLSWDGLSDDSSAYLVPLFWVSLVVAGLGLGLRRVRVPAVAVVLLQVVVVAMLVHRSWGVGGALGGWLPTAASLQSVGNLMSGAVDATARYAAPIPAQATDFPPLMLASGAAVVLLVDLLACTLRRVPLAGLPLLAAFTVPVSVLGGVSWLAFALAAASFVFLLAADQAARLGTWGRSLAGSVTDSQPHSVGLGTVWPTATRIGFAGIGLAVLAPAVLPVGVGLFTGGDGTGTGGDDEVTISNPMLDLRRDLIRGKDIPLLSFTTDDPAPAYLRFSVLDEFNGAAWIPSDRDIPPENRADGALPPAPGLSSATKRTEHTWSISVTDDYKSTWLPVPYPATDLQVQGDWRYDERTLDFFTPTDGLTTSGLDYEVVGAVVHATNTALVSAPPANRTVFVSQTALPASVPSWLEDLARDITDGARSNFERAVMLQQWFREDGGFEYSTASGEGNSTEQLALFLGTGPDSRKGYCEQFAAAMTLLARSLGIPARIAVGFLRPERQGDTWVYSAHDEHAWPEIYFEGTGWVRFEPTPETEAGAVEVPAYTTGRVPAPDELALPSSSASAQNPDELPTPTDRSGDSSAADAGSSVGRWAGLAAVGVLVLGVLALPRAVRALLRRRRLSGDHPGGAAEGGWAEVRATALDLGLGWDDGVTLRRRARALSPTLAPAGHRTDQPAGDARTPVEALERLVLLLERCRFSRTGLPQAAEAEVPALTDTVTDAMRRGAKPRVQRRATWLPASLWRSGYSGPRRRGTSVDRLGELDRVSL